MMRQLNLRLDDELINRLVNRPRMKWQWILKMAAKNWITEHVSDRAAKLKRNVENDPN
jgi:hypothetical protein